MNYTNETYYAVLIKDRSRQFGGKQRRSVGKLITSYMYVREQTEARLAQHIATLKLSTIMELQIRIRLNTHFGCSH